MDIYEASFRGDLEYIKQNKDKVNGETMMEGITNAETPLNYAIEGNQLDAFKLLLRLGANINAKGGVNSCTPLMKAIYKGNESAVEILLKLGADLSLRDVNNYSVDDYVDRMIEYYKNGSDELDKRGDMKKLEILASIKSKIGEAKYRKFIKNKKVTVSSARKNPKLHLKRKRKSLRRL